MMIDIKHVLMIATLALASCVALAGVEDHIVIIASEEIEGVTIYGVLTADGFIVTDGNAVKPRSRYTVTFLKGRKNEFSTTASVLNREKTAIAFLALDDKPQTLPHGFDITKPQPQLRKNLNVKLWNFTDQFSSIDVPIEEITVDEAGLHSLRLPGYLNDATGYPITLPDGTLAGIVTQANENSRVWSREQLKRLLDGNEVSNSIKFLNIDDTGFSFDVQFRAFDPLKRLQGRLALVHFTGPHYAARAQRLTVPGTWKMPGDSDLQFVPMIQLPDQPDTYHCKLTALQIPYDKDLLIGFVSRNQDGSIDRFLVPPSQETQNKIFGADLVTATGMQPCAEQLPPDLPPSISTKESQIFPAVDMTKISFRSFFPMTQGSQWTYTHKQLFKTYTSRQIACGFFAEQITSDGKRRVTTTVTTSHGSHGETYWIHKRLGDRAWLKVYKPKDLSAGAIRDGRYDQLEQAVLEWQRKDNFAFLVEIRQSREDGAKALIAPKHLVALDLSSLKRCGLSTMTQELDKGHTFSWRTVNGLIKTPAGRFSSYLLVQEHGPLTEDGEYEIISYYYPGVGLIKEEHWMKAPDTAPYYNSSHRVVKTYEMTLKSFYIAPEHK